MRVRPCRPLKQGIHICGAADAMGTCKPKPEVCADVFAPVCGCDGKTYRNACSASSAGSSVAKNGECN